MGAANRHAGREHFPRYPKGWIVLRIFQLIFSIAINGLCGYSLAYLSWSGTYVMAFTSSVTFIISIWLICAHSCAPGAFNYWAVLVFDLLLYLLWLVSFAGAATQAAAIFVWIDSYTNYSGRLSSVRVDNVSRTNGIILATAAGFGAFQFLFFFIAWVTDAVVIYRHRKAGLHCKPIHPGFATAGQGFYQMQLHSNSQYAPVGQQDTSYNPQLLTPLPTHSYASQQHQQQQQYGYPPEVSAAAAADHNASRHTGGAPNQTTPLAAP